MKTAEVVEAALIPELLWSVAVESLKEGESEKVISALKEDVSMYRSVLPVHAQSTFDRYLNRTATEVTDLFYNKQTKEWDAVSMFSTFIELALTLQSKNKLKVSDNLQNAVGAITEKMYEQHEKTWEGMMKSSSKRAAKVLQHLNNRGYFK